MDPDVVKASISLTEKLTEVAGTNLLKRLFTPGSSKVKAEAVEPVQDKGTGDLSPRAPKTRAGWDRRGTEKERRQAPVSQRMRKGFWLEFHRKTELGKFDPLLRSNKTRDDLFDALIREAVHYRFSGRSSGAPIETAHVVDMSIDLAWADWSNVWETERNTAVNFIESVAEIVISKYNIVRVSRRAVQRRES